MQIFNTWPELSQLALPKNVKTALIKHLLEPFQTEAEAKAFWLENSVCLFLSEPPKDSVPEYSDALTDDYIIQLVIANDSGGGNYYVSKGVIK